MTSIYRYALEKIKADATLGDKLLEETEQFLDVSAELLKRIDRTNPARIKQRKQIEASKTIVRTTSIY